MSVFTEGQIGSKVRVPFSHLANNGDVSMDDIEQASGDPDGAVVVDVQGGGDGGDESIMMAEQAGPRETTDVMEVTDQPAYGAPGGAPPAPGVPSGVATPGAEPAPAPAVPGQPTPAPARARRNIQLESRFNPNYRYTNEDFYGPRGPDIYSDNAVGGKLYIPRAGELPMGLFASFMQESQKRKAKVEGAIADLMKSSQVKPTADPYQPAFTKLVTDWQNNYVAGLAEQYGGNSQLAWAEIAKEGSDANKAYLDGMRAMDALGQFVKFQWADADKYIQDVRDGKLRTTPEQKKRAEDVFYGIGNLKGNMAGGDFVKLAQQTEALKRDMNELKWYNEFVLPMAPDAYKKASSEPVVDTVGGKRILRQRTKEETDKEFHRIIAQAGRDMIGADPAELQKKVEAWFPRVKSETETVKFLPGQGEGGSNGGGGNTPAGARVDFVVRPGSTAKTDSAGDGVRSKPEDGLYTTISTKVGSRWEPIKQATVYAPSRQQGAVMMNPQIGYENGWVLRGLMADTQWSSKVSDLQSRKEEILADIEASDDPANEALFAKVNSIDTQINDITSKHFKEESVPLDYNQDFLSRNTGYTTPQELFAKRLGMSVDAVKEAVKTKEGRLMLQQKAGLRSGTTPAAATEQNKPSRQQLADEWQAMKNANPKMTAQQVTDAINKKYKLQ